MKHETTYIIGEIGQNHNGSVDIAKLIIDLAARSVRDELFELEFAGINAVKMTKRDLNHELSAEQAARPYKNQNSFGDTYLEHRQALELSDQEHFEVYQYAKQRGLDFVETLCAPGCLSLLDLFTPDYLKVASRDLTNLPLLQAMAETKIPIILSTGMADQNDLNDALDVIVKSHEDISILHCVSQYPTHPDNANLMTISFLREEYPQFVIGYSDHTIGISAPVAAVALGAKIIEKHITIDRRMKGSDQAGSLGPDGVHRMARDIRLIERSMGKKEIFVAEGIESSKAKLERSIATKTKVAKGQVFTEENIHLVSPGDGFQWNERDKVIGHVASENLSANQTIYPKHLVSE